MSGSCSPGVSPSSSGETDSTPRLPRGSSAPNLAPDVATATLRKGHPHRHRLRPRHRGWQLRELPVNAVVHVLSRPQSPGIIKRRVTVERIGIIRTGSGQARTPLGRCTSSNSRHGAPNAGERTCSERKAREAFQTTNRYRAR